MCGYPQIKTPLSGTSTNVLIGRRHTITWHYVSSYLSDTKFSLTTGTETYTLERLDRRGLNRGLDEFHVHGIVSY